MFPRLPRVHRRVVGFITFGLTMVAVWSLFWKTRPSLGSKQQMAVNYVEFGMGENKHVNEVFKGQHQQQNHVVLLKTHRTGSSVLEHILKRFGMKNNLTTSLFRSPSDSVEVGNVVLDKVKYDIVSIYSRKTDLGNIIPADAVKIAIVREPLARIASEIYKKAGGQQLDTDLFKSMLSKIEPNRMSKSFGIDPHIEPHMVDRIKAVLDNISHQFGAVLLYERLEESVVLVRRLLGWSFVDILFIARDVKTYNDLKLSNEEKQNINNDNYLDVALYNYFANRFDVQVSAQADYFDEEVVHLRVILTQLLGYCNQGVVAKKPFAIEASIWHEDLFLPWSSCKTL